MANATRILRKNCGSARRRTALTYRGRRREVRKLHPIFVRQPPTPLHPLGQKVRVMNKQTGRPLLVPFSDLRTGDNWWRTRFADYVERTRMSPPAKKRSYTWGDSGAVIR
jgi:hypothetical protein